MRHPQRIELPTGLPIGTVNVYLFAEPEPILVDTGVRSKDSQMALEAGLAANQLTLADLKRIIISHPHIDHCGLAGLIVAKSQATVHVHETALPWLIDYRGQWRQRSAYYRDQLFRQWQLPLEVSQPILDYMEETEAAADSVPSERIIPFRAHEMLAMGDLDWQILHTPGHASSLTCFYQPDTRQFLSTDMLLPLTPTPIVEKPPAGQLKRVPSLPQFLDSLDQIEKLDSDIVYPGHGQPFDNPIDVIQYQRARIAQRKEECLTLIQNGVQSVADLLLAMYPNYPPRFRFAGLWMVIGYLDLLKAEDRIEWIDEGDLIRSI